MNILMIHILMPAMLLGWGGQDSPADRYPHAVEVYHCNFDASFDKNADGWPDNWTRRRGPGYPSYVNIRIEPASTPSGKNCLQVELDGGQVAVFTPPIPAQIFYSYVLEAYLRVENLKHDRVFCRLTFLDKEKYPLISYDTQKIANTDGWLKLRLGPIDPLSNEIRSIV
ncbi:MAG: hypothetical protein ACWGMZ_08030, partial [Thermoguttaceae bacterium]